MSPRLRILCLTLVTALALAAGWASALRPSASDDAPEEVLALERVHADPQGLLGQLVRVRFQLQGELERWNPYMTRFGAADYRAFTVWSDGQFLWEREQWERPLGQLYVRRGGVAERALAGAPQLARFEAIGRVRQVFLGRPWIELEQARRIGDEISESTLLHASRGVVLMEEQRWAMALEHLERALVGAMPAQARAELRNLREIAAHPPRDDSRP